MMKRLINNLFIAAMMLFTSLTYAKTGLLFKIVESGPAASADMILCLNGKGPLSCQNYHASARILAIKSTANQQYPAARIKVLTPGYKTTGCTPSPDGYCLFAVNSRTSTTIVLNGNASSSHTVGGTISGLVGSVSLQNNGGDTLTQSSNGSFTFVTAVARGSAYSVTVSSQPATQTCTVTNGSGTMGGSNITNVQVTCSTNYYTVGGTVSGLVGSVSLQNNGGDTLTQSSNGSFTFATSIAEGSTYSVTVSSQPATQTCTVSNGSGTMGGSNITNVQVTCSTNYYTVGGTVSGLSGSVSLQNNSGDTLTKSSNGSFTFATSVAEGSVYSVTVSSQPATQTCTVTNGSGTMGGSNVTNVQVSCSVNTYTVGGSVTGLSGSVSLQNNGGDTLTESSNGSFTFATSIAEGSTYSVTVSSQPATQTCTVTNGSGTMGGSNITNVQVSCSVNTYTVGGTISGLVGSVSLQNNGGDTLTYSTDGNFTFATAVAEGSAYSVTVSSQPATQTCTVSNGSGTMGGSNITNVQVTCSVNTYTVGGTVSGLVGSVSLQNNGGDTLMLSNNGSFTFATSIAEGSTYSVTVSSQPAIQTCTVSSSSGTMGGANVTTVQVTCSTFTYTVGGSISGLSGSVTLENNGGNALTLSSNGSFTFTTAVAEDSPYSVTVHTQPSGQTCTITNGSGTMGNSNVTNVSVSCVTAFNTSLTVSANGTIPVTSNGSSSGSITITNTGTTNTAYNVSVILPSGWTDVTQNASNCASIAPNNGTCTITFTSTTPYVAQGSIQVIGENLSNTPTTALAFTVSGYLVWQVVDGSTVQVIDSVNMTSSTWGGYGTGIGSGAQSVTNGATNTTAIVSKLGTGSTYAAELCNQSTNGGASVGTWYLPAICQMGTGVGPGCTAGTANIVTNLVSLGFGTWGGGYWSSSEAPTNTTYAWTQYGQPNTSGSQGENTKNTTFSVRCVRSLTY